MDDVAEHRDCSCTAWRKRPSWPSYTVICASRELSGTAKQLIPRLKLGVVVARLEAGSMVPDESHMMDKCPHDSGISSHTAGSEQALEWKKMAQRSAWSSVNLTGHVPPTGGLSGPWG